MSLVYIIVANPMSNEVNQPFVASEIITLENVEFGACVDICYGTLDRANLHLNERWTLSAQFPDIIRIICEDERGTVAEIVARLRIELRGVKSGSDIRVSVDSLTRRQNEFDTHADIG